MRASLFGSPCSPALTRLRSLLVGLVLAAALSACADQTAMIVEVRSDELVIPLDVDSLRFQATSVYGAMLDERFEVSSDWPHSVTIVPPPGETAGRLDVTVTAFLRGSVVASRSVVTMMVPGVTSRETVVLGLACTGATCPDGGMPDGGMPTDGGPRPDAGMFDAGMFDAGPLVDDAAVVSDAAMADAGRDAGRPDAARPDAASSVFRCLDASCVGRIVLSEVATGGPGGGADEFVEIYNVSSGTVDVGGLDLRYASSSGAESSRLVVPFGTLIESHHYLLLASTSYTGATTPDVAMRWTTGLAGSGGTVLLAAGGAVVDQFGWGTASVSEGSPFAAVLSGSESYERKASASSTTASMAPGGAEASAGNGFDTQMNSVDWLLRASRDPQGAASSEP